MKRPLFAYILATVLPFVTGCSSLHPLSPLPYSGSLAELKASPTGAGSYIKHVIVVIQENRSYDNLFATFPNGDGALVGKTPTGTLKLRPSALAHTGITPPNTYGYYEAELDGGKMDGFLTVPPFDGHNGSYLYQYVDPKYVVPYWTLAKQYVLADHMFQTQGSGSFTGHQDLIRGDTAISKKKSVVDNPTGIPWGCNAATGTVTDVLVLPGKFIHQGGPYPCFTYETLRDTLDAKHISWKYYEPAYPTGSTTPWAMSIWSAFAAVKNVFNGPEWSTNISSPETNIFTDISKGTLPSMSWVVPDFNNSDHPGGASDTGPSWVASIVNAVGKSQYWKSTAIVVVWDDWGGWYDHELPPKPEEITASNLGGPGFRVPMIVVSPYARKGYVSHHIYEFGSVVKFVETVFGLPSLHTTDETTNGFVSDFFDFTKSRNFTPVATKYSKFFFQHQAPSNRPVDTE